MNYLRKLRKMFDDDEYTTNMSMETYNKAMEILDKLNEKVDFAIAQLTWLEIKDEIFKNGN